MSYLNPKTGATIGYQETKGTTAEPYTAPMLWQSSTLSYVPMLADSSGNLLTSGGGGGGGGNAAAGLTGSSVPTSADYLGFGVSGVLTGVSASTPLPVQAKQVITPLSPATASVSTSDSVVVSANSSRTGLIIMNLGSVNVNFGCGATAILNGGITLTPNGTWVMDTFTFYNGAIHAIASAASTLAIQEYN
jgi:hypothetical protein